MGGVQLLLGTITFEIISADVTSLLQSMNQTGITLYRVECINELTVRAVVNKCQFSTVEQIAVRYGAQIHICNRSGVYWIARRVLQRPVLLIVGALLLFAVLYLPTRILFVVVDGNQEISAQRILESAAQCGLRFGTSRRDVRSERIKNALIADIPEIQWVGVNTKGCVARVSVREKSVVKQSNKIQGAVSSVVAARDGIIRSITATRGAVLCQVGQAVKAGEILVSGYMDCGISIQAMRAEAEIFAQTQRQLTLITPSAGVVRSERLRQETRYGLLVGKKLIKFYKDSGILDSTCVKMYSEEYLTLPGDFQLPVALVIEQYIYYKTDVQAGNIDSFQWVADCARHYLESQMIAGQVLSEDTQIQMHDGLCALHGQYACQEMIAQVRNEEILRYHGKDN